MKETNAKARRGGRWAVVRKDGVLILRTRSKRKARSYLRTSSSPGAKSEVVVRYRRKLIPYLIRRHVRDDGGDAS